MMAARRCAIILPVVLVVIGLLALTMGGFMFFVRAELAGARAQRDAQQARLTAESGLEEVVTILRLARDDPTAWWDVPDRFRHALVWAESYTREDDPVRKMGSREEILANLPAVPAWRFSVVAENLDGLPDSVRYGITPEAGKLNLNARHEGWEAEIERLLIPLLEEGLQLENASELLDALLDWLDEDDETRPGGAETEYYSLLEPGYHAKNGRLDTLEELLLVKGWSAALLYGEDTNRNGILDPNEDDGDESFPCYDSADGVLDRGIVPYVTVWSREQGEDGEIREGAININAASIQVLLALEGMLPEEAESIVALREELESETLADIDWPVSEGLVEPETYETLKPRLTTQALQFRVEVVGYADHAHLSRRFEWVIEMRGSVAQVIYHRDLTALGLAWPVDDDTIVVTGF